MRFRSPLTVVIQVSLIVLLGVGAIYSFSSSSAFRPLLDLISRLFTLHPLSFSLILAALLLLCGFFFIVIKKQPSIGLFICMVSLLCANSLLAFSTAGIGWLRVLGAESVLKTQMTYSQVFLLAVTIIVGYIALRYTTWFDNLRADLRRQGGDSAEVEETYRMENAWTLIVLVGAVLMAVLITFVAHEIKNILVIHTGSVPLRLIAIGIGCSIIVIGAVYTLVMRGRPSSVGTANKGL